MHIHKEALVNEFFWTKNTVYLRRSKSSVFVFKFIYKQPLHFICKHAVCKRVN